MALLLIAALLFFTVGPGSSAFRVASAGGAEPSGIERLYLPTGPSDQVVHHAHYSLGYEEAWEQPRWVAYRLAPERLTGPRVRRTDDFRPDPDVRTGSAERSDYRRSGYSRGHLVPAGDMVFSQEAMSETFYYSNLAPQLAAHNGGIWRELEETTRDWVRAKGPTYVVSGPIVDSGAPAIGSNRVAIPRAFYKVLLTENGEGIAFVVPHEVQTLPLGAFAKTIDEVEVTTGLDFFPELESLATEAVEARIDLAAWPHDEERYRRRLESWNNAK